MWMWSGPWYSTAEVALSIILDTTAGAKGHTSIIPHIACVARAACVQPAIDTWPTCWIVAKRETHRMCRGDWDVAGHPKLKLKLCSGCQR